MDQPTDIVTYVNISPAAANPFKLKIFRILAQAALRAPPEVALQCVAGHRYCHRSVFPLFFGPGLLVCASGGGGQSEAGHCFHLLRGNSRV